MNTFTGIIKRIWEEIMVGKDKKKPLIDVTVEETNGQYPQSCTFAFLWRSFDYRKSAKANVWDIIDVDFSMQTREYNGRYYNSVNWQAVRIVDKGTTVEWDLPF